MKDVVSPVSYPTALLYSRVSIPLSEPITELFDAVG